MLRPSILTVYQVAPERLELDTLYDNIRVLGSNAQKTSRFEIALWNKVFYPVAVLVMMILALPFAHFQRRQGGVGFRIFVGHDPRARVLPRRPHCSRTWACSTTGRRCSPRCSRSRCSPSLALGMMWYIERR